MKVAAQTWASTRRAPRGHRLLLSALSGAIVALHYYQHRVIAGRIGTLIVSGVLFLFGMQLVFLGLLADMIRTHTKY